MHTVLQVLCRRGRPCTGIPPLHGYVQYSFHLLPPSERVDGVVNWKEEHSSLTAFVDSCASIHLLPLYHIRFKQVVKLGETFIRFRKSSLSDARKMVLMSTMWYFRCGLQRLKAGKYLDHRRRTCATYRFWLVILDYCQKTGLSTLVPRIRQDEHKTCIVNLVEVGARVQESLKLCRASMSVSLCKLKGLIFTVVQVVYPPKPKGKKKKSKVDPRPVFIAEPVTPSNSFVGTEEYIAPVRKSALLRPSLQNVNHVGVACWYLYKYLVEVLMVCIARLTLTIIRT